MLKPGIKVQTYNLGGGYGPKVYPSTIKHILLKGQSQSSEHHYIEPYLLQAIRATFQRILNHHDLLFVIRRDIYSPNNVSVLHVEKCFKRFAEAYIEVRNGKNIADVRVHDDITYAELLDRKNHISIYVEPQS